MKVYYNGAAAVPRGTVMKQVGTQDISAYVPGNFPGTNEPMIVPKVAVALATDPDLATHPLFLLDTGVDGTSGAMPQLRVGEAVIEGMFAGMDTSGMAQGDPVYVTDLGALSKSTGTFAFKVGEMQSTGQVAVDLDNVSLQQQPGADNKYLTMMEDFLLAAGATLPIPWGKTDVSAAGAPTTDYIADAIGGQYTLLHANTDELETIAIHHADQRTFDITKKPIFECRLKIAGTAAAVPPLLTRIIAGLASDYNATWDSMAVNAWFKVEGDGATRSILWESDDGTTDTDDQDTTIDYAEDTFITLRIDCTNLSAVKFYINGVLVGTASIPLATGNVQPIIGLQKDGGTGTMRVTVDYVWVRVRR